MSLILEALRKLEREKQTPERGLVVTGASTWARAEEQRGLRLGLIVLAGLSLGAGAWLWRSHGVPVPAAAAGATGGAAPASVAPAGRPAASDREAAKQRLTPRLAAGAAPAAEVATGARPATGAARDAAGAASSGGTAARATAGTNAPARDARPPAASQPAGVAIAEPGTERDARAAADAHAPAEPVRPRDATASDPTRERATAPAPVGAERPAAGPDNVVLQAVTERDGRPLAIVNGRLVREGDSFDGIRIVRIRASEIEVEIGGKRRTVGF